MRVYKNCNSLPIYNLYMMFDTNDVKYLIKDIDYEDSVDITENQYKILKEAYNNILYEYADIVDNKKLIFNLKKKLVIANLEFEYNVCTEILKVYEITGDFEVVCLLNEFQYNVTERTDINKFIQGVVKKLRGLKNRIKILKIKEAKAEEKRKEKSDDSKAIDKLNDEAVILEGNLDLKYNLDIHIISVAKWEALKRLNKRKLKSINDGKNKSKFNRSSRKR